MLDFLPPLLGVERLQGLPSNPEKTPNILRFGVLALPGPCAYPSQHATCPPMALAS